ncbi:hypothetical protein [Streptomyces acidicola]|uniref:Secreted protein n=1 Tax=Streptomyces acidicola TaxID=2596892 RepID=A0A5N8X185_9ACTN|nr:hypothetical protein [Streptomyces acidicola]MPY53381.1 hypothetical protein [Streptomyces acidicola]
MPHTTWTRDRRGAVIGASAVLVCLGGALASCGSADGDGYVAVGSGAGSSRPAVAPTGDVTFVPLDDGGPSADPGRPGTADPPEGQGGSGAANPPGTANGPATGPDLPGASGDRPADDAGSGSGSGRTATQTPSASTPPPSSDSPDSPADGGTPAPSPTGPAGLSVSEPEREPTDKRWCEKVTVQFRNTGGTAVRSGKVTFGTHVIGPLGIDWATVESTRRLPAPIAGGSSREKTWTVCVEEWRVPLGMHIETQDVSVKWK